MPVTTLKAEFVKRTPRYVRYDILPAGPHLDPKTQVVGQVYIPSAQAGPMPVGSFTVTIDIP